MGQLENTLIFYCADNGASGEGSPNGSVNENKFFNEWPDEISENLALLDQLGSPDTYNHYPTGWAMGSRPHFGCSSATATRAASAIRLSFIGPRGSGGGRGARPVSPLHRPRRRGDAPTAKETQYFEMLGTRGLWHHGCKAVTEHAPMPSNKGHFDQDRRQLFHTDENRSEAVDLSDQQPEKVKELVELWFQEARGQRAAAVRPWADGLHQLRIPRAGSKAPPTSTACPTRSSPRCRSATRAPRA